RRPHAAIWARRLRAAHLRAELLHRLDRTVVHRHRNQRPRAGANHSGRTDCVTNDWYRRLSCRAIVGRAVINEFNLALSQKHTFAAHKLMSILPPESGHGVML